MLNQMVLQLHICMINSTGAKFVEALIFFRLLYSNCLNWKFTAKITHHLHIYPQFIYESFHIHYIRTLMC